MPPSKEEAKVAKIRGLYIYILSEPQVQYEIIKPIKNDLANQLGDATDGKKKFGKILEGIAGTAAKNADFQHLLNNMIELSQECCPEADGLIFDRNMSNARVIKFKSLTEQSI